MKKHFQLALLTALALLLSCGGSGGSSGSGSASTPPATSPGHVHTGGPTINNALIPPATTKSTDQVLTQTTADILSPGIAPFSGNFRIVCLYSHMSYDDPLVYPGQPGRSHLHTFFGNTSTNAYSTPESLLTAGNSTCNGGIMNRSAYWVPSLINTVNGAPIAPHFSNFYYKGDTSPQADIQPMPNGLRLFAGDPSSSEPPPQYSSRYRFHCVRAATEEHYAYGFTIPDCPAGDSVGVELWFPSCWDGKNLDSANHKSHMTYSEGNACPSTHPVALPQITFNIAWRVPVGSSGSKMRLASDVYDTSKPAGYSMHGDWLMAWKPDIMNMWINNCVRVNKDCGNHMLADNLMFYGLYYAE